MKNTKLILGLSFIIGLVIVGCTKYPDIYDSERQKDISITYYDTTASFGQYLTYSIVDTVPLVQWNDTADSIEWVRSTRSDLILNEINSHMASLGYTKVDTSANPDLFVNASVLSLDLEYVSYYSSYPYYGWGGGYYWGYPGYGYSYPYYYPYYYTQSYGTVLMEMIDAKNVNESTHQFKVLWTGMVVGATNDGGDINSRISNGINDCFNQSSYLQH